jgi:hypothetical protein
MTNVSFYPSSKNSFNMFFHSEVDTSVVISALQKAGNILLVEPMTEKSFFVVFDITKENTSYSKNPLLYVFNSVKGRILFQLGEKFSLLDNTSMDKRLAVVSKGYEVWEKDGLQYDVIRNDMPFKHWTIHRRIVVIDRDLFSSKKEFDIDFDGFLSFVDEKFEKGPGVLWILSENGWIANSNDEKKFMLHHTYTVIFPSDDQMGAAAAAYEKWLKE